MAAKILCLIVLLLECRALYISFYARKWLILLFYTQISSIIAALSAFFLLLLGQPQWVTVRRYLSTCMLVFTFLVTVFVLVPLERNPRRLLWSGTGLYQHVLCPILSTVSYVLAENHAGSNWIWLPVALTLVYGLALVSLVGLRLVEPPYPFLRVHEQPPLNTVLWILLLLAVIGALSAGVCWIAK